MLCAITNCDTHKLQSVTEMRKSQLQKVDSITAELDGACHHLNHAAQQIDLQSKETQEWQQRLTQQVQTEMARVREAINVREQQLIEQIATVCQSRIKKLNLHKHHLGNMQECLDWTKLVGKQGIEESEYVPFAKTVSDLLKWEAQCESVQAQCAKLCAIGAEVLGSLCLVPQLGVSCGEMVDKIKQLGRVMRVGHEHATTTTNTNANMAGLPTQKRFKNPQPSWVRHNCVATGGACLQLEWSKGETEHHAQEDLEFVVLQLGTSGDNKEAKVKSEVYRGTGTTCTVNKLWHCTTYQFELHVCARGGVQVAVGDVLSVTTLEFDATEGYFVFQNVRQRWESGLMEWSQPLVLPNANPAHRFPFELYITANFKGFNEGFVGLQFCPQPPVGNEAVLLEWPIPCAIRITIHNARNHSDEHNASFVLEGEEIKQWFQSFVLEGRYIKQWLQWFSPPPSQQSSNSRGWDRLIDRNELMEGGFCDNQGRVVVSAEMLPQPFPTVQQMCTLADLARTKGGVWVVEGVRNRWRQGMYTHSPQLSLNHSSPSLRYSFMIGLSINVPHDDSTDHVGVYFVPRRGPNHRQLKWPIFNHIRISIINSTSANHKTRLLNGARDKEFFAKHKPPKPENAEAWGHPRFLTKEEVFGNFDFVDNNDRMFINVEVLDSGFD